MAKTTRTRPEGYDAMPRRFKDYLVDLESKVDTLNDQVPAREPEAGRTVKIVDPLYKGHDGYLPDDTTVEFEIGGLVFRVHAARRRGYEALEVSTTNGYIAVHPECANVVVVAGRPDIDPMAARRTK